MKKIVIIGTGKLGEILLYHLKKEDTYEVVAFSAEERFISDSREYLGLPVVPFEIIEEQFPPTEYEVILTIGHTKMNRIRERMFRECKKKGYIVANYIHPTAYVSEGTQMGEGNIILEFAFVGPFAKIGNSNILWNHVKVAHDCLIGDFNSFSGSARLSGQTIIHNNCFLGADAAVIDKLEVSDYTFLGASTLATHDTAPYEIIVPAKNESITRVKSTVFCEMSHI